MIDDTTVFSADWLAAAVPGCRHTYHEGFVGTPTYSWNGWQIFTVTPQVMAAIVDHCQNSLTAAIAPHGQHTDQLAEAWLGALASQPWVSWLGPLVVVDSRTQMNDPTWAELIAPDDRGRYRVGFGWTWDTVNLADVHTVHRPPHAGLRLAYVSVRGHRQLLGGPAIDDTAAVPAELGDRFATHADITHHVHDDLRGISAYWQVQVINPDGAIVRRAFRDGYNGTGDTWTWRDEPPTPEQAR